MNVKSFLNCTLNTTFDRALYALLNSVAALHTLRWHLFLFCQCWKFRLNLIAVNITWHLPEKDSPLRTHRDNRPLIGGNLHLIDAIWMAFSFIITDTLIIIVNLQSTILSTQYEMFSLRCQINSIQLLIWTLDWSDYSAVVLLPVSYFSVWTGC